MKTPLLAAALLLSPTALMAQPYSESMADCASVYQNAARWMPSEEHANSMTYAAQQWHAAAVKQSHTEGREMTETAMWEKVDAKTKRWESKGALFPLSEEFNDWATYCQSFAGHVNVAYKP